MAWTKSNTAALGKLSVLLALWSVIEPTFDIEKVGNWVVMRVHGEVDMATAPTLRQRLQSVTMTGPTGVVLDLSDLDFIDSTGLGVMVGAAKRMRVNDGTLRIACSQTHLLELFSLTRLDEVFELFDTVDDALADVTGAPS